MTIDDMRRALRNDDELTTGDLRRRGWTQRAIDRLNPDRHDVRLGRVRVRLYRRQRIEAIEYLDGV